MKVCIFEDEGYRQLYPLTFFRSAFELRCGHSLLWEKMRRKLPDAEICFFTRNYLVPTFKKRVKEPVNDFDFLKGNDVLFLNGRRLLSSDETLSLDGDEEAAFSGENLVYLRLKSERIPGEFSDDLESFLKKTADELPRKEVQTKLITNLWDLIVHNGEAIEDDFKAAGRVGIEGELSSQAAIFGDKDRVYVAGGAQVHPFAVLDSTGGSVFIDENAVIYPHSRIEGPAYIGKKTKIVGGKIRECCSIGPVCMVGGEVEEAIFQGYANKFHDGFIGHAYICEWVNLGALTTNSDIKNNYSPVKIYVNGELTDTGTVKMGSFIGDHSKLGIGALLNTGTVIGACSNIFSGGMPPKIVPSFAWGSGNKFVEFKLDKAINLAGKVAARRKVEQTQEDIDLIKKVYELTVEDRKKWGVEK